MFRTKTCWIVWLSSVVAMAVYVVISNNYDNKNFFARLQNIFIDIRESGKYKNEILRVDDTPGVSVGKEPLTLLYKPMKTTRGFFMQVKFVLL